MYTRITWTCTTVHVHLCPLHCTIPCTCECTLLLLGYISTRQRFDSLNLHNVGSIVEQVLFDPSLKCPPQASILTPTAIATAPLQVNAPLVCPEISRQPRPKWPCPLNPSGRGLPPYTDLHPKPG